MYFLMLNISFITLGFELLGIGLVLPFLDIIINTDKINFMLNKLMIMDWKK